MLFLSGFRTSWTRRRVSQWPKVRFSRKKSRLNASFFSSRIYFMTFAPPPSFSPTRSKSAYHLPLLSHNISRFYFVLVFVSLFFFSIRFRRPSARCRRRSWMVVGGEGGERNVCAMETWRGGTFYITPQRLPRKNKKQVFAKTNVSFRLNKRKHWPFVR